MASEIKVNTIKDLGGNTIVSSNGSGTFTSNLPSTTINNNADNRVITGSGTANTLNGEANLTFDGGTLTVKDDANGATTETLVLTNGTSANPSYSNLVFKTAGNTSGCWIKGVQDSGGNDGRLEFHVNNSGTVTQAMKMTYNGNVGIGETAPLGKLHVKTADSGASVDGGANELVIEGSGDAGLSILSGTSGEGSIYFGDSGNNNIGYIAYRHNGNYLGFGVNGAEPVSIRSDGNFLVGQTNNSQTTVGAKLSTAENFMVVANAPVLILNRQSSDGTIVSFKQAGTQEGSISISGSSTSFNTSSDYRLKENVDYSWDATTRLKELKPARFNWIADETNTLVDGFIAHEVSSVVPEAITGTKDAMHPEVLYKDEVLYTAEDDLPEGMSIGDTKSLADELPEGKNFGDVKEVTKINPQGIDQSKLVPLLVKTIQELEARITTLENA